MSLLLSPGFFFGLKAEQLQDLQAGGVRSTNQPVDRFRNRFSDHSLLGRSVIFI